MKKVGLVTFYNDNFGSTLQCYATKTHIEKKGFSCEVLAHKNKKRKDKIVYSVKNGIRQLSKMAFIRGYYTAYKAQKQAISASSKKGSSISTNSKIKLDLFVESVLQPRECSDRILKTLAREEEYVAFIAGSDQIWNGAWPVNPFYFLEFAPANKRVAFAASIGTEKIENCNCNDFSHYIKQFRYVSIREKTGVRALRDQIGIEAENVCDPTVLLNEDEWSNFASFKQVPQEHYLLAHFIDIPNEQAVKTIDFLATKNDLKVIVFGYHHSEFILKSNVLFIDGDSRDYVGLIHNAEFVCTDSFHTSVMSLYFFNQFFVFDRQYNHKNSQASRITSILSHYQCPERFVKKFNAEQIQILSKNKISYEIKDIIIEDRKRASAFLDSAIESIDVKKLIEHPDLEKKDCVACGACVAICSKDAIRLEPNIYGTSWPVIDSEKCIKCNQCETVCKKKVISRVQLKNSAYIAFNRDNALRSKSASGGVFSALAKAYIEQGGIVVGAAFCYGTTVCVKHLPVYNESELQPLLKSKYVQSDCTESYIIVGNALKENKCVLFSGTSCQIDGLNRFLEVKKIDRNKLSTIDLVCHGTPEQRMFSEYVKYIESKYHGKLIDFSFRQKDSKGKSTYVITAVFQEEGEFKKIKIPLLDSYYYKYFLSGESYRENCYYCRFASINKPADITIGDYFEAKEDYPELFQQGSDLEEVEDISCVIVNTEEGKELLMRCGANLYLKNVAIDKVQASHPQLCKPSMYSSTRLELLHTYKKNGSKGIRRRFENERKRILITNKLFYWKKKVR